jgi:hypothetical protein
LAAPDHQGQWSAPPNGTRGMRCNFQEHELGNVSAWRENDLNRVRISRGLIVLSQTTADFGRVYANDRVSGSFEVGDSVNQFNPDCSLLDLVHTAFQFFFRRRNLGIALTGCWLGSVGSVESDRDTVAQGRFGRKWWGGGSSLSNAMEDPLLKSARMIMRLNR